MAILQEHKNTFSKGLNVDFDPNILAPEQYIDAANVTLVPSGKFMALQNIAGTTNLQSLGITDKCIGVFATNYTIGTRNNIPCLTIFTVNAGNNLIIWCYDPHGYSGTFLYKLYTATAPSDYVTTGGGVIDGVLYPEKGMDILYFTDNYYEVRKIRCNIQAPNIGTNLPFLTDTNMAVSRRRAVGQVNFVSTSAGGTLLTGTYQLAYQLINLNTNQDTNYNKYTRFSLLTTPIYIYNNPNAGSVNYSGIGLVSNQQININITPTSDELANYTHFRLAIVENVGPEDTIAFTAKVTEIQPISTYLIGGVITNYVIKNNYQNNTVTIDEIVIDTAAIDHVKTLNIKNNVLFAGNINYKNLTYNNGTPAVTSGSIIRQTPVSLFAESFTEPDFATNYKGHFRDEVYRYAIAYFDKFGNFSSPLALDMSAVTNNQSSASGFKDMKFPKRSQKLGGITYTLYNPNGALQSLGLQLNGIANHPTWAYGFIILRVPRKKNILFQTPLIPMSSVYGLGPIDNYPSIAQEGVTPANVVYTSGTSTANATGLQASPPGPVNVYYPSNLSWVKKRSITKVTNDSGAALNLIRTGEAQVVFDPTVSFVQIFPQGTMYTKNHPYISSTSHTVETVDAVVVTTAGTLTFGTNTNTGFPGPPVWNNGTGDTSCTVTFIGFIDTDFYYDSGHSGAKAAINTVTNNFAAYTAFETGSPGTVLNGAFVMQPDSLETKGVTFGWKPMIQKCGVAALAVPITAINDNDTLIFAGAAPITKPAYPFTTIGNATDFQTGRVNTLEIVNVTQGLPDTRYGSTSALNNYIYTGVQVNFTASEITNYISQGLNPAGIVTKNVSVFGGDCFVSTFNFKISDTVYSCVNQEKFLSVPVGITSQVAVARWGRDWLNTGPAVISLPVALRNASQYLAIILESEFNGATVDVDTGDINVSSTHRFFSAGKEYKCRSPLVYNYNYNVNKQNDQKIFIPIDPLNPVLTTLKSRIVYTNTKIYNTSTDGFDTIPVLNFYDLPETYGGLTKLAIEGNNMYSVQQRGIAYIPIGQRVIETTDAANLQVRSGDMINTPVWIDIKRGSQHLRSVKETGTHIYMLDNENQAIYRLQEQELTHISDKGIMSTLRSLLNNPLSEQLITTTHDILRNEIWFSYAGNPSFHYIWNEQLGLWVSRYSFDSGLADLFGGVFINNQLYLIGIGTDNFQTSIHTMYTGNYSQLMGNTVTPIVTFVANPNSDFGKTFDDILVNAAEPLASLDTKVFRNTAIGFQSATTLSLNVTTRSEGNYRAKILRDIGTGARMRGTKAQHTLTWSNSGLPNAVTSAITQWRPSFKQY